jgi:hypothetical protein
MIKKIISLILIFSLVLSYSSLAFGQRLTNEKQNKTINNKIRWAVIITVGEPERDQSDANALIEILKHNYWEEDNILYLKENEVSRNSLFDTPNWLNSRGCDENDLVLFYFSTHGAQKEDIAPFDEEDGLDEFIMIYKNEEQEYEHILDDELSLLFNQIVSKNLLIIFETCHSGGMIDGANDLISDNRIIITSSDADESSYPFFSKDSWLFPYYFLKGLRGDADLDSDGYITAEEAFEYSRDLTVKKSTIYSFFFLIFHKSLFIQHPQMYDAWPSVNNNVKEMILVKNIY